MIITEIKPEEELQSNLKDSKKIFVFGCGGCCATCQTGGEPEVAEMAAKLGGKVVGTALIEEACDLRFVRRDLRDHRDEIQAADTILGMTCGSGIQTVVDFTKKAVTPALNTLGLGQIERLGQLHEKCRECADCILDSTGGICPVTLCPKALMNGPCGGTVGGKCEVGNYERDCAWVKIFNHMKGIGQLDKFITYHAPRRFSCSAHPRDRIFTPRRSVRNVAD